MSGSAILHENQSYAQYIGATALLPFVGAAVRSNPLSFGGRYALMCPDTDVYIRQGGAGFWATSSDSVLRQGDVLYINVDDVTNNVVSVMTATALGGTLRITRIDSVAGNATGKVTDHKAQFYSQYIGSTLDLSVTGSPARSSQLAPGRYFMVCMETDVYVRQGGNAVNASSNEMLLPMGFGFYFTVDDDVSTQYVSVVKAATANGTLRVTRMSDVT